MAEKGLKEQKVTQDHQENKVKMEIKEQLAMEV